MDWIQTAMGWIDNPIAKYALTLIGGFVLKQWPTFPNRFIPLLTGVVSILMTLLHHAFPEAPSISPAVAMAAVTAVYVTSFWDTLVGSLLRDAILPWLMGIGTHSTVKNTFARR